MKTTFGKYWLAALAALITFFASAAAYAQTVDVAKLDRDKWFAMAGALGLGIAALGGGLGQGRAAAAALEGIARNPGASGKILVPMILGLALIESLVIYALVIAFQLSGKIS